MLGLGRMGANMLQRLATGGHRVVGFDPNPQARAALESKGLKAVATLDELLAALPTPRVLWLMLPAGEAVDATLTLLRPWLCTGDTVVDGGNSQYQHSQRRTLELQAQQIDYLDCGTSGGIWGLENGYSLMIGGAAAVVERLRPLFETLAAAPDKGWGHVGPSGAGHYSKMIHNGIEYGLMQAYAEGFSMLKHKPELALDLHQIAEIWRTGSVVRSWLLDLISVTLEKNPMLDGVAPYVADSGEGRWAVAEAITLNVPAPVITLSLIERLRSRDADSYTDKLLAATRNQFGGHVIKSAVPQS